MTEINEKRIEPGQVWRHKHRLNEVVILEAPPLGLQMTGTFYRMSNVKILHGSGRQIVKPAHYFLLDHEFVWSATE